MNWAHSSNLPTEISANNFARGDNEDDGTRPEFGSCLAGALRSAFLPDSHWNCGDWSSVEAIERLLKSFARFRSVFSRSGGEAYVVKVESRLVLFSSCRGPAKVDAPFFGDTVLFWSAAIFTLEKAQLTRIDSASGSV